MNKSPIDLRTCKPGDKLLSKHGAILTYVGPNPYGSVVQYPHMVQYPDTKEFGHRSFGTRTHDGFIMVNASKRLESDHDIVEILGNDTDKITKLESEVRALRGALAELRHNVDVSTINNSKRSTARWSELVKKADKALNDKY